MITITTIITPPRALNVRPAPARKDTGVAPRPLGKPSRIAPVQQAAAYEWAAGWWAGIVVGAVNGVGLAVIAGWLR